MDCQGLKLKENLKIWVNFKMKISDLGNKEEIEETIKESAEVYKEYRENKVDFEEFKESREEITNIVKQVIDGNGLLTDLFSRVRDIEHNRKKEYLADCERFGLIFNLNDGAITIHT